MAQEGERFGRYELHGLIGEGAMARVYKAYDPATDRHVALKVLKESWRGDQEIVDRFLREARAAGALDHPGIVKIHSTGDAPAPYIDMALVEGPSLAQLIRERGRLPVPAAVRIARQLAQALDYAHGRGRVHRDVKPSNILLEKGTQDAKLTDFGIAIIDQPEATRVTRHGELIGTPRYMAPEQVRGERADGRADLFSLGATIYEMLAGAQAFPAETLVALTVQITQSDPAPLSSAVPEVPASLAAIVERLLAKAPKDRFQSGAELVRALEAVERHAPASPSPPPERHGREQAPAPDNSGEAGPRRWPAYLGGLAVLLLVVGGLAWLLLGPRPPLIERADRPPIANPDSGMTRADNPAAIAPLANDVSPGDAPLRLVEARLVTGAGAVRVDGDLVIYDPSGAFPTLHEGETANVEIAYTAEDGHGRRAEGRVNITVSGIVPVPVVPPDEPRPTPQPTSLPPVASDDRATIRAGDALVLDVTANDRDPDSGEPVRLVEARLPPGTPGEVRVVNNLLYYDPGTGFDHLAPGETAEVTVIYTIQSATGARAEGRAIVTVQGRARATPATPAPASTRPGPPTEPVSPTPGPSPESTTGPAPTAPTTLSPVSPPRAPGSWLELAERVMRMPCSWLEAEPGGGELRLRGVTGTAAQKEELQRLAQGLDRVGEIRIDLLPPGSSLCRAIDMAGATALPNPASMVRLVQPADGACAVPGADGCYRGLASYRIRAGERLVLETTTPDFPSYVIVDYLMADGNVGHLWPSPGLSDQRVPAEAYARTQPPGQHLWIGDRRAGPVYIDYPISAPFGREMVMVVASPAPLFTSARPGVEQAGTYIDALGNALRRAGQAKRPRVSLMPIETMPAER